MLVILEKNFREENGEYQEEGPDRQDDREKTQAYELEVIVTTHFCTLFAPVFQYQVNHYYVIILSSLEMSLYKLTSTDNYYEFSLSLLES